MDLAVLPSPPEHLERLRQADWDDLYPRALWWAKTWHKKYLSDAPSPWEPMDLLHEAIEALYSGRRTFPKEVPLLTTIINVMKSMAGNVIRKKDHQRDPLEEGQVVGKATDVPAWLCEDALRIMKGDEIAVKIITLWCEDPDLPARDLAAKLGIDVKEVYNAHKRMKRKLDRHLRDTA